MDQSPTQPTVQLGPYAARANQSARVVAALQSEPSALTQLTIGKVRVGRQVHRLTWRDGRQLRFVLDLEANAVAMPRLLSISAMGLGQRAVRQLLRPYLTANQEHDLLDPSKGELRAFIQHGSLSLSITVLNDAFEYCTRSLLRIAACILDSMSEQRPHSAGGRFP